MSFSRRVPDRGGISTGAYILVALLLALSLVALSACGNSGTTTAGSGTVAGTISVGPLCPVEPCTNPGNPFAGLKLVISDAGAVIRAVEVAEDGSYSVRVPVGDYEVNLQPCEWMGCQQSTLPEHITVQADKTTTLDISIDTGIR